MLPHELQAASSTRYGSHQDDDQPTVSFYMGAWDFITEISPECLISLNFTDEVNAAGTLDLNLVTGDWSSDDLIERIEGAAHNKVLLILVEFPGTNYRWHGIVTDSELELSKNGGVFAISAIHSWQHLEQMVARNDPAKVLKEQPTDQIVVGGSAMVISGMIARNAAAEATYRVNTGSYQGWYRQAEYTYIKERNGTYPIAVKPISGRDDSFRVTLTPGMRPMAEVIREVAGQADLGFMVTMNLWLPGDKQPWSGAGFTMAQLWVEVEDRSIMSSQPQVEFSVEDEALINGNITMATQAKRFWAAGLRSIAAGGALTSHLKPGEIDTIPTYPPATEEGSGVLTHRISRRHAKGGYYIYGGDVEAGFTSMIEMIRQSFERDIELQREALQAPETQEWADAYFKTRRDAFEREQEFYLRRLFQWREWQDPSIPYDPFRLRTTLVSGVDPSSYSALAEVVRAAVENTEIEVHTFEVMNRSPWVVFGDFGLGDLLGIELSSSRRGVAIQRLTSVSYSLSRESPGTFTLIIGDPNGNINPFQALLASIDKINTKVSTTK